MNAIEQAIADYRAEYFAKSLLQLQALPIHPDQVALWAEQNRWALPIVKSVIEQFNEANHVLCAELDFYNDPDSFGIRVFPFNHRGRMHSVYGDLPAFVDLHEQLAFDVQAELKVAA